MVALHAGLTGKCKHRSQMHMKGCLITKRHVMVCFNIGACLHVFKLACSWHQTVGHSSVSIAVHA